MLGTWQAVLHQERIEVVAERAHIVDARHEADMPVGTDENHGVVSAEHTCRLLVCRRHRHDLDRGAVLRGDGPRLPGGRAVPA